MGHEHDDPPRSHQDVNNAKPAASATFHCLMGYGLGEVVGIILATMIGLGIAPSINKWRSLWVLSSAFSLE